MGFCLVLLWVVRFFLHYAGVSKKPRQKSFNMSKQVNSYQFALVQAWRQHESMLLCKLHFKNSLLMCSVLKSSAGAFDRHIDPEALRAVIAAKCPTLTVGGMTLVLTCHWNLPPWDCKGIPPRLCNLPWLHKSVPAQGERKRPKKTPLGRTNPSSLVHTSFSWGAFEGR